MTTGLGRLWTEELASHPGRAVLHDVVSGWTTAGELEEMSGAVARHLATVGLKKGDRIVMSAAACTGLAVAHIAALRLGLVVVPMNPAYSAREIHHVVKDAGPAGVVCDDTRRARLITAASGERPLATVGIGPDGIVLPAGPKSSHADLDVAGGDDPGLIVYTSGTTGRPKGAVLSHASLLASADAVRTAWQWTPEDRLLLPLPLFHVHGLAVGLYGTLGTGASVVIQPSTAPGDIGDAVKRHSATMFFGVPTIYARLTGEPRLRELRLCVSGSAPLPAELHRSFEEATGQQILERYGMTETLMIASNPYLGERRPGTVGFALAGVELVLDRAGSEEPGEILVRGPNVFSGYWKQPDATEQAFDGPWFRTGDIGQLDGEGYLRIVGRKTEVVISGGYNVYPREVEDVLRTHPDVVDAAVVGWPDPTWGETVVAFVETTSPQTLTHGAIHALAAGQLAPYKRPRIIQIVAELPRNALGKVVKADLRPRSYDPG
ncbi:MAG: class I adenylate-forming enzyme family protein [Acidimicrobiales bacterium]